MKQRNAVNMVNLCTGKEKEFDEVPQYIPLEWKETVATKLVEVLSSEGRK